MAIQDVRRISSLNESGVAVASVALVVHGVVLWSVLWVEVTR